MNIIVAVDSKWGIGKDNNLLFRISKDLSNFKALTLNKVVVMGYNTLISLPKSRPLANRTNIVLTSKNILINGTIIVHNLDELFSTLSRYESEDIFIIGGEKVYKELLPYSSYAYVTKVEGVFNADKFFPDLDKEEGWELVNAEESMENDDFNFTFTEYKNKNIIVRT